MNYGPRSYYNLGRVFPRRTTRQSWKAPNPRITPLRVEIILKYGSSSLTAESTLTAISLANHSALSSIVSISSLTANIFMVGSISTSISNVSSLTANIFMVGSISTSISNVSSLTANVFMVGSISTSISNVSSLTANAVALYETTSTIVDNSALNSDSIAIYSLESIIGSTSDFVVEGIAIHFALSSMLCNNSLSSFAICVHPVDVTIVSVSEFVANADAIHVCSSLIEDLTSLVSQCNVAHIATSSIVGSGDVNADPATLGIALITGSGTINAIGSVSYQSSSAIVGTGTVGSDSQVAYQSTASIIGTGIVFAPLMPEKMKAKLKFRFVSSYNWFGINVRPKFKVGDILYRCDLVSKGIIEKVMIKEVLLDPPSTKSVAMYKDNLNCIHNERDLCNEIAASPLYFAWVDKKTKKEEIKSAPKLQKLLVQNTVAKYKIGDIVYRCDLAAKGIIEKVMIKEICIELDSVIYKDNLNCIHNERDLCNEVSAAKLYYSWVEKQKLKSIKNPWEPNPCKFPNNHVIPAENWYTKK